MPQHTGAERKKKTKSKKQVGKLLGKNSPLNKKQKDRFKSELKSGRVKVKK